MNKRDILILVALVGLWLAWPQIDRKLVKPLFPAPPPKAAEEVVRDEDTSDDVVPSLTSPQETVERTAEAIVEPAPEEPLGPEDVVVLENDRLAIHVSSRGAGLKSVTLKEYPSSLTDDTPVEIDFGATRALVYKGFADITRNSSYRLTGEGRELMAEVTGANGLSIKRTFSLGENYVVDVVDQLSNTGSSVLELADYSLQLGSMSDLPGDAVMKGMVSLGVDTLSPGGEKVQFWGKRLKKFFDAVKKEQGKYPVEIKTSPHENAVDWVAVKNKYFVQILTPEGGAELSTLYARRATVQAELEDPNFKPRMQPIEAVGAWMTFGPVTLEPGEKTTRHLSYYVGPKKYTELSTMGLHQVEVMEFGKLGPIGKLLLRVLIAIHKWLWPHSYGLAIMLLTILIRIIFWPITHKGTESMKRMQEIQPLITELREKHKDNPQKLQQETMALYKEHKVNPLGGCLPMLIQIPVLFAMFSVLRSAIELRFARFLWIKDLSGPERIFEFGFSLPLVGWDAFNILPILMAGTMFWQQKMTPSAGDSQQQKMMAFMPVMMLFFFYNMPSGLVLYWTTSQFLMIAQQLLGKRKAAAQAAAQATA